MFGDGALTLREFARHEPLPLATIHEAVLGFLRRREDAVLFGAQGVNAYVDEPRMTQDVDILSTRAAELAEELRRHRGEKFHIAVRVGSVADGKEYQIFQLRRPESRHLADVRQVSDFPPTQLVAEVRVPNPEELIAQKLMSYVARRGQPKSGTDWRDLTLLLLTYPNLNSETGAVLDRLSADGATEAAIEEWRRVVSLQIHGDEAETED